MKQLRRTPLKRSAPPRRTRLKRSAPALLPQWVRDWWKWVKAQRCAVCTRNGEALGCSYSQGSPTEVAHVGQRGLRQKCDPREVLPLCGVLHHRLGPYSHHRLGKRFWSIHGLDRRALVKYYRERYELETGKVLPSASGGAALRVELSALDREVV